MTGKSARTRPGQTLAFAATGVMAAAPAAEPAIVELQPDSPRHELAPRFFAANVDLARERDEWMEDALIELSRRRGWSALGQIVFCLICPGVG